MIRASGNSVAEFLQGRVKVRITEGESGFQEAARDYPAAILLFQVGGNYSIVITVPEFTRPPQRSVRAKLCSNFPKLSQGYPGSAGEQLAKKGWAGGTDGRIVDSDFRLSSL